MKEKTVPDVSLIVPIYQAEKYIENFVSSLLHQTHENIEIILVDDGSTDSSGKLCDKFAEADGRISVIHKKNEGAGRARNAGLDIARGKYVYFCDCDDKVDENLIEENLKSAFEYDAEMVTFSYRVEDLRSGQPQLSEHKMKISGAVDASGFKENFNHEYAAGGCVWNRMFKRSMIEEHRIRMNDQIKGEDTTFIYKIYSLPPKCVVYNPKAYYTYVRRNGSLSTAFHPDRMEDEYSTSRAFEKAVDSFGFLSEKYRDLVFERYVSCYSASLENMARDEKMSLAQKRRYAVKYFKKPEIRNAIKKLELKKIKRKSLKIKVAMLKIGMVSLTVIVQEIIGRGKGES
jgi:glycosyltransferase involved in cell wall biosynthesis